MTFRALVADRFVALYGPPQTTNPALYYAEWSRVFDGMDAEILSAAVDRLVKQHKFAAWPTIGELTAAVEAVREEIEARRAERRLRLAPPREHQPTDRERARAAKVMVELRRFIRGNTYDDLLKGRKVS